VGRHMPTASTVAESRFSRLNGIRTRSGGRPDARRGRSHARRAAIGAVVVAYVNGQNFRNTAYNWRVLAWVTGGESLHNNHHAHPRAPRFSMRRFEFDPWWVVIRSLALVGLVQIVGAPVRLSGRPDALFSPGGRPARGGHGERARGER